MEAAPRTSDWDAWAPVYDQEHADADPGPVVEALAALASGGPALELAAGTGRIAIPLAARGVPVVAVDVAPRMLERLEAKRGHLPIRTVLADIAAYEPDERFPLVFCVYSGLFCLGDKDAQEACLRRAAGALQPGGRLIIEALNPAARRLLESRQQVAVRSIDDDGVRLSITMNDPVAQTVVFSEVRLGSDGVRALPVRIRYIWPSELDLMARLAGLRLVSRAGGWDGRPYDASCISHVSIFERDT